MEYAMTLQIAGGAQAFVVCVLGWYLFTSLMLASVDAPISLPGKWIAFNLSLHVKIVLTVDVVFDLSTKIKGASERQKRGEV